MWCARRWRRERCCRRRVRTPGRRARQGGYRRCDHRRERSQVRWLLRLPQSRISSRRTPSRSIVRWCRGPGCRRFAVTRPGSPGTVGAGVSTRPVVSALLWYARLGLARACWCLFGGRLIVTVFSALSIFGDSSVRRCSPWSLPSWPAVLRSGLPQPRLGGLKVALEYRRPPYAADDYRCAWRRFSRSSFMQS